MTCRIENERLPVACQSEGKRAAVNHPPPSRESGNPNRMVKTVHWVRSEVAGKYGTNQSAVTPYCEACCPVCGIVSVVKKGESV